MVESTFKGADIVFTFDTTGSMYPCLTQVRRSIRNTVERLFMDIPNLRIGIIAHGDYCDKNSTYVTKILNLAPDVQSIVDFIMNVGPTGGGDSPECYELVLQEARTKMNWQSGREKILVMIGDDVPHNVGYRYNYVNNTIDWRNELGLILESDIHVYGIHCMPGVRRHSENFYREIAKKTEGYYITLDQFASITDLIMGICYRQMGIGRLEAFEAEVKKSGRSSRNIEQSFRTMSGRDPIREDKHYGIPPTFSMDATLVPVPAGRFQIIPIDEHPDPKAMEIRHFIERQGIMFKPGRGFYELVKPVEVQQYKEIILVDRRTGDIFNGSQVRVMLGLSPQRFDITKGGEIERLKPVAFEKYKVFIQSTSYNRKLIPGTCLMYEIPDWDMIPSDESSDSSGIRGTSGHAGYSGIEKVCVTPVTKVKPVKAKTVKPPVAKAVPADPTFKPIEKLSTKKTRVKKEVIEKTDIVTFVVTAEVKYTLTKGKNVMLRSIKNKLKEIEEISTDGVIKVKTVK